MTNSEQKYAIESAIRAFDSTPLYDAGMSLLDSLGYQSDLVLRVSGLEDFRQTLDQHGRLDDESAKTADWKNIEFLRQITGDDLTVSSQGAIPFQRKFNANEIQSYVFLAIELLRERYTRSELAQISRGVNRVFDMPAMIIFKHGTGLSLAIINRRLHKRDKSKDVLEKVTLVKDITCADPLRAHIEIVNDLSFGALHAEFYFHNFLGLHQAWEKRLASYALNERFYREIANWYFWALNYEGVHLPRSIESIRKEEEREKQRSIFFIRLLTRLVFCWFLQEKRLLPRDLFRRHIAEKLLKDFSPQSGTYYQAFLQNLFFATLNQEQEKRDWRKKYKGSRDGHRGITNLWRYQDVLSAPDKMEALLRDHIPFVNGGLFDCLDDVRDDKSEPNTRLDDFSEEKDNHLCLPNDLFFGEERLVDLSSVYDDKRRKKEKVRGLLEILSHYKFTVEENTPLEEEIALDPELLGKVFENLLASYNEDTRTTARKALGAFYTPREIVSYMVDESLRSYLTAQVPELTQDSIRTLFMPQAKLPSLTPQQKTKLVAAIGRVKILDPACGSGAFPIGALHRLVDLLQKLDPNNESWKRDRLAEAETYFSILRQSNAAKAELEQCESRIEDIRHSFDTRFHALDFARKLYLIENCIYGVDIQPIACQIAKLRFFIALIVDQNVDPKAQNLGVRPLPNLETKIVAADSLIPIEKPSKQMDLLEIELRPIRRELELVRHDHFSARTPSRKARCREKDAKLRTRIAQMLRQSGMPADSAKALAAWDPYDQNHAATFFDPEWMFGFPVGTVILDGESPPTMLGKLGLINGTIGQMELAGSFEVESGFDIVIGNPPYVRIQTLKQQNAQAVKYYKEHYFSAKKGSYDLYVVFVEVGLKFLKPNGHLAYILPHKFFNAQYGEPLRDLLAKGKHLQHVVHFGDQQVFPGATNYVCLLFLARSAVNTFHFVQVDDLSTWLEKFEGSEGCIPISAVTKAEWNFVVGRNAPLFEYLNGFQTKLGDVADIFVGLQTSADDVFILKSLDSKKLKLSLFSRALDGEIQLERDLLRPLVSGQHVGGFAPLLIRQYILFPYEVLEEQAALIALQVIEKQYPLTAEYLLKNRQRLEGREGGKFDGKDWYRFGRNQNLGIQARPKVCVPRLVNILHAGIDLAGDFFLDNVDVGGVTWKPRLSDRSLQLLLALLNSAVLRWLFPQVSAPFRGGFRSANRQFLALLPVPVVTPGQEHRVVALVNRLLMCNQHLAENPSSKAPLDAVMLGYWEQTLNGLIYELYFPTELHSRNLHLFDLVAEAALPDISSIPVDKRLNQVRIEFDNLYDLKHPLRSALHDLQTVEEVRIIEGKA